MPAPSVPPPVNDRTARLLFVLLSCALLGLMLCIVPHYGSSGDELWRCEYGKHVLRFYTGIDLTTVRLPPMPGRLPDPHLHQAYGGLFDGTAAALTALLRPRDEYLLRHYLNTLYGFGGLLLAGLIARELTGRWSAALAALILLALTPRYWGECFNNPKDIPFAATTLLFVFALLGWLKALPRPGWRRTLFLAVALMLPLCIRPAGLLFVGCFLLIAGTAFLADRRLRTPRYAGAVAMIALTGYCGCMLFWPLALNYPLAPLTAFREQSKYMVAIHVLFEGQLTDCRFLPWYYVHKLLLLTLPLLTLSGLAACLWAVCSRRAPVRRGLLAVVLALGVFPLVMMIVRGTVLYDGIRQVLFILALLTVAAAVGLEVLVRSLRSRLQRVVAGLVVAAGLALPLRYMAAAHPNEYIYYNELAGGVRGAFGHYELDYYMNSVRQAFDWLQANEGERIRTAPDSLVLASDCEEQIRQHYNHVARLPVKVIASNLFSQHTADWDYAIYITRYLDREELLHGYFSSPKAIHVITADGTPICTVLRNDTARYGHKGYEAYRNGQYDSAAYLTRLALAQYPQDVELWTNLAQISLKAGRLPDADNAITQALRISKTNHNTVICAGDIAVLRGDLQRARSLFSYAVRAFRGTDAPWLRLAQVHALQGDTATARRLLLRAPFTDPQDQPIRDRTERLINRR